MSAAAVDEELETARATLRSMGFARRDVDEALESVKGAPNPMIQALKVLDPRGAKQRGLGIASVVTPPAAPATGAVVRWEDPPARLSGRGSQRPAWLDELAAHPNRWGLIAERAKSVGYGRGWRKRFPQLEVVSRRRPDGAGFLVYGRIRSGLEISDPRL